MKKLMKTVTVFAIGTFFIVGCKQKCSTCYYTDKATDEIVSNEHCDRSMSTSKAYDFENAWKSDYSDTSKYTSVYCEDNWSY